MWEKKVIVSITHVWEIVLSMKSIILVSASFLETIGFIETLVKLIKAKRKSFPVSSRRIFLFLLLVMKRVSIPREPHGYPHGCKPLLLVRHLEFYKCKISFTELDEVACSLPLFIGNDLLGATVQLNVLYCSIYHFQLESYWLIICICFIEVKDHYR